MTNINDELPNAHLFRVEIVLAKLAEIAQYLQEGKAPKGYYKKKKTTLTIKAPPFTIINGSLYKLGLDNALCRCVLEHERHDIIEETHSGSAGRHFQVDTCWSRKATSQKLRNFEDMSQDLRQSCGADKA